MPGKDKPKEERVDIRSLSRDELAKDLAKLIADVTGSQDRVSPDTRLNELEADSLDRVEIVMQAEERYSVSFPQDYQQPENQTVRELADYIKSLADKS